MANVYCCPRCGYETKIKSTFMHHLNRKRVCSALISNFDLATIDASNPEKYRHISFKLVGEVEDDGRSSVSNNSVKSGRDSKYVRRDEFNELKLIIDKLACKVFQSNPHHINSFGFETTYHIDVDYIKNYWSNPMQCVIKVITDVYMNDSFPENKSISKDGSGGFFVHRGSNWVFIKKDRLLKKVIEKCLDIIEFVGGEELPSECSKLISNFYNNGLTDKAVQQLFDEVDTMMMMTLPRRL